MFGLAISDPSGGLAPSEPANAAPRVLHLALTRSAAVRLAPVADALPGPQTAVDIAGRVVSWHDDAPLPPARPAALSAAQAAEAVSEALDRAQPHVALLAGDGDIALACALAVARADVPLARLGAGQRCGDRGDRGEINRIAIDELAIRLYTDSDVADEHLLAEGADPRHIHRVGSTLAASVERRRGEALAAAAWTRYGVTRGEYVLTCLDRAEDAESGPLADALQALSRRYPILVRPGSELDYVACLSLEVGAAAVVTDSADVQEETTVLGVPCVTLARWTECSLTVTHGTNTLVGDDPKAVADLTFEALATAPEPLWDADAGIRVAADLLRAPWEDQ